MSLSLEDAINQLDTVDFSSRESVKEFLGRIDANDASGTITLFYGGDINDAGGNKTGSATELAKQVADSDQRIRIVDNTSAAQMLSNPEFLKRLAIANGLVDEAGSPDIDLIDDRGSYVNDWLYNKRDGLWADTSGRFAAATTGPVRLISPNMDPGSTFALVEYPALLEKSSATDIDGTSISAIRTYEATYGTSNTLFHLADHSYAQVQASGLLKGDYSNYLSTNTGFVGLRPGLIDVPGDQSHYNGYLEHLDELKQFNLPRFERIHASMKSAVELSESLAASGEVSQIANRFGLIGSLVGFSLMSIQVSAADDENVKKAIATEWAVDAAGSAAGEAVGAAVAALTVGAATAVGVTVAAPVVGAMILGGALVGGFFGADTAADMHARFKNLDDSGKQEFFDQLSFVLFGEYSVAELAIPESLLLNDRLTLDITFSADEMVAQAQTSIAWRYALLHLNTFVLIGDDSLYDIHNQNGELNIDAFSDQYLKDRAEMLVWRLQYDNAGKEYDEDWNTLFVSGDWNYTDHSISVSDGANSTALTFRVDGLNPFESGDHKIEFGTEASDSLDGGELSDSLYGMGGHDFITGWEGDDYLEGGTGSDTYTFFFGDGEDIIFDPHRDGESNTLVIQHEEGGSLTSLTRLVQQGESNIYTDEDDQGNKTQTRYVITGEGESRKLVAVLASGGGSITIENFDPNAFGIGMEESELVETQAAITVGNGENFIWNTYETPVFGATGEEQIRQHQAQGLNYSSAEFYTPEVIARYLQEYNDGELGLWSNDYSVNPFGGFLFEGSVNDDRLIGSDLNDELVGHHGDDRIEGGDSADVLVGNAGSDQLLGGAGNDLLFGAYIPGFEVDENDVVIGQLDIPIEVRDVDAQDYLDGGAGADMVVGSRAQDIAIGGAGDDMLLGGLNEDVLSGGDGADRIFGDSIFNSKALKADGSEEVVLHEAFYSNQDNPEGLSNDDVITGGKGIDVILGERGSDFIDGGDDTDFIFGDQNSAPDFMGTELSGPIDLNFYSEYARHYFDLESDEGITESYVYYDFGGTPLDVTYHDDDLLYGGKGHDYIEGNGGDDRIFGGEDDDQIRGDDGALALEHHGDDTLYGEQGVDAIWGNGGNDHIEGGEDSDYLYGGEHDDVIYGGAGNDLIYGDTDNEDLEYQGDDEIWGGSGDDQIFGGDGDDKISGGSGVNTISAGAGNDTIYSNGTSDRLDGGDGNDRYIFQGVSGSAVIKDSSGSSELVLEGISSEDVSYSRGLEETLVFLNKGRTSTLFIENSAFDNITSYVFADGVVSDLSTLRSIETIQHAPSTPHTSYNVANHSQDFSFQFDSSVAFDDVLFSRSGADLKLYFAEAPGSHNIDNSITFIGYFSAISISHLSSVGISGISFSWSSSNGSGGSESGNVLNTRSIFEKMTLGSAGDDNLHGSDEDDPLRGFTGNDDINGHDGYDTATFAVGDGYDSLVDVEKIVLEGVTEAEILIPVIDGEMGRYYSYGVDSVIEYWHSDGELPVLVNENNEGFVLGYFDDEGSNYIRATENKDVIYLNGGSDEIRLGGGDDAVFGGEGNVNIESGEGYKTLDLTNNRYATVWDLEGGEVTVGDGTYVFRYSGNSESDVDYRLVLGDGIVSSDLINGSDHDGYSISVNYLGGELPVYQLEFTDPQGYRIDWRDNGKDDYYSGNAIMIEENFLPTEIVFSDGEVWSKADLLEKVIESDHFLPDWDYNYMPGDGRNDHKDFQVSAGSSLIIDMANIGTHDGEAATALGILSDGELLAFQNGVLDLDVGRVEYNEMADLLTFVSADTSVSDVDLSIVVNDSYGYHSTLTAQVEYVEAAGLLQDDYFDVDSSDSLVFHGFEFLANDGVGWGPVTVGWVNHGDISFDEYMGVFTYQPDDGFLGQDSFEYFVEHWVDGQAISSSATVTLNVVPKPNFSAQNDLVSVVTNTGWIDIELSDLLGNDYLVGADDAYLLDVVLDSAAVESVYFGDGESLQFILNESIDQFSFHYTMVSDSLNFRTSARADVSVTSALFDVIEGTFSDDLLFGGEGNDQIDGGWGIDDIDGGAGHNLLLGGGEEDYYYYSTTNNGVDRIVDSSYGVNDRNYLEIGQADIAVPVVFVQDEDSLVITWEHTYEGSITIDGYFNGAIEEIYFSYANVAGADNQYSIADVEALLSQQAVELNVIELGAGNNYAVGTNGSDLFIGGQGNDTLIGEAGDDTFVVEGVNQGYDRVVGGDGVDSIVGGTGDDRIGLASLSVADSIERFDGGEGVNTIAGSSSNSVLDFSSTELLNIDQIEGGAGHDTVTGSQGNDRIVGGTGNDTLRGEAGDDTFVVEGANQGYDRVNGGEGVDSVVGGAGDDRIGLTSLSAADSIERFDGGEGVNTIAGSSSNSVLDFSSTELLNIDQIEGGAGHDRVTGSQGDDRIVGGTGNDTLRGEAGDDTFVVEGANQGYDRVSGGAGIDSIVGGAGDDRIGLASLSVADSIERFDGGEGVNTIAGSSSNSVLDFSSTELLNINQIEGGAGHDRVTGSQGDDRIVGGTGNDTLRGEAGDDTFVVEGASQGYDRVSGGDGIDRVVGSVGDDRIGLASLSVADGIERFDGGEGVNTIAGSSSNSVLDFSSTELLNIDQIEGGAGHDTVTGSQGNDRIVGGTGNDTLRGEAGDDTFVVEGANQGYDRVNGGEGVDSVVGGAGDDRIGLTSLSAADSIERFDGGEGVNTIAGSSSNSVLDFSSTELLNIDQIEGGAGHDRVTGSQGDDRIVGGTGNDTLRGEAGDDTFVVEGSDQGYDRFIGGEGVDTVAGGAGDDRIAMTALSLSDSIERFDGGAGENVIAGSSSNNALDFSGTELINIDRIEAGSGHDRVTGSQGSDRIVGGTGNDLLAGGGGDDVFEFFDGFGRDRVLLSSNDVGQETLFFNDLAASDLWFSRQDNNLLIQVEGSINSVTVDGWFETDQVKPHVVAGDQELVDGALDQLIQAMSVFDAPIGVGVVRTEEAQESISTVLASSWG